MLFFAENWDDANFCTEPNRGSFKRGAKGIYKFPSRRSENVKKLRLTLVLGKILKIGFFKRVNSREIKQLNRATGYYTQYGARRWVRLR